MKHIKLLATLLCLLVGVNSHAYDFLLNGVYYDLNVSAGEATVTNNGSYGSYSGSISIPETIIGPKGVEYDVVAIGDNAFRNSTGMTSVTIASSIDKIGTYAFYGCTGLTNVKFPNSVTEIGEGAFYGCTGLIQITLPKYITTLSKNIFKGCSALTSITIPTKVTTIEGYAFSGCSKLASVNIPTSITRIGEYAFNNCSLLANITIPSSVLTIEQYSFLSCTSLTEVTIKEGVTTIDDGAFKSCTALKNITLPRTVTNLGGSCFYGDNSLVSANLNCNFKTLGASTFYGCTSLANITLPASLETMESQALANCTLLSELTIPAKVTNIASDAISSCSAMKTITFAEGMSNILRTYNTYISNVVLPHSATSIASDAFSGCSKLASVSMPVNMTTIGENTFYGCSSLATVDMNKAQTIGKYAFYNCTSLANIAWSAELERIDAYAFSGCTALTNAVFPSKLLTISEKAFYSCSALTTVTLPAKLETIGNDAFADCNNLTSLVYAEGTGKALRTYASNLNQVTIPSTCAEFGDNVFYGCSKLTRVNISHLEMWNYLFANRTNTPFECAHTIYLNDKLLTDLLADFGTDVSNYAFYQTLGLNNVTIMNSTKGIADNAFSKCPDLVSVVIGNGATYVGKNAFEGCSNLQSVKFGKSVKLIDNNAFYGCSKLQSVKMGGKENVIGENTFYGCSAVERITLPATVTSIGNSAFSGCKALRKINIPEGVTTINPRTFSQCVSLGDVAMPEALTSVQSYAFYDCDHLVTIQFGDKLETIGDNSFNNCDSLRYVHIGTGIKSIGDNAFSNCPQLVGFYISSVIPPTTQSTTFSGSDTKFASVYVPTESVSNYKSTSPWSSFGSWDDLSIAPIYVKTITVEPNVLVMEDDGGGQFKATVYPENATNKDLSWTSMNSNIAYVNKSGMVMASGEEGITTITCKAKDGNGAIANCLVIVNNDYKPIADLTIDKNNLAMTEGDVETITATLLPDDATYPEILWTSTDNNVATVSSTGVVTAVEKGNCTITATANDGSQLIAKCKITVSEPVYASLALVGDVNSDGSLNEDDVSAFADLLLGNRGGIDITAYDFDKNGKVDIADVVYVIRCIKENKNKPAGQLKLLKLGASKYSMFTDNKLNLTPTLVPYNAGRNLVWSSSDDSIATVDSIGTVSAILPGTVTITAKANDGSGITGSCAIKIEKNPYGYADGYEYVDLGLPSGTLWATMNIGAKKSEESGLYFTWGETTGYTGDTSDGRSFNWASYKLCKGSSSTMTKYCTSSSNGTVDSKTVLDPEDDAATANWGNNWCMPTHAQQEELVNSSYTSTIWTTVNGVYGRLINSKTNGTTLFLPAAGYRSNADLHGAGSYGDYWSSELYSRNSSDTWLLSFNSGSVSTNSYYYRYYGQTVRPVCSEYVQMSSRDVSLKVGTSTTLSARYISLTELSTNATWSSDNPSIATVDANGNVKAICEGTIYIRATFENGKMGFCKVTVIPLHEYVDLGLPSGTLWATTNVGAENPEDVGLYFAWGETTGYTADTSDGHSFDWTSYKWCNGTNRTMIKYCSISSYGTVDNKIELDSEDDAATVNWGKDWQMPSKAQQDELRTNCTWTWDSPKKGYIVKSKTNSNSIFLPAAGYRGGSNLSGAGSSGFYWSRSLYRSYPNGAYGLTFETTGNQWYGDSRCCGLSVRPVRG